MAIVGITRAKRGLAQLSLHKVTGLKPKVAELRRLARLGATDASVRAFAVKAVSARCGDTWCADEKDYDAELRAVFDAVRQSVRYVRDHEFCDTFQHPARTLEFGGGDCDDYATLLASLLLTIGYPCWFRVIKTVGAADWDHIYLMVGLPPARPTRYVSLDGSVDHPAGWEVPRSQVAAWQDFKV